MNDSSGWIKIHRSILEWEWWDDRNTRDLFIFIIISANHKSKTWHGKEISVGSFVTSLQSLAFGSGLSVQQVRTSLNKLKSTGEITDKSTSEYRIITVCNYDKYQTTQDDFQQAIQQTEQQASNKQITSKQQANNNNQEYKNERSKEEEKRDTDVSQKKFSFLDELVAIGVDKQIAEDWIKVRKTKRLSQTRTAMNGTIKCLKEIKCIYGLSFNDAIRICVEHSWGGCRADFFKEYSIPQQQSMFEEKQKNIWQ